MNDLKFPWMREELIDYLKDLSDPEYQYRVWVKRLPEGDIEHDELDYAIHFLYDDTHLAENPYRTIGSILYNDREAKVVEQLTTTLDKIFSKYGKALEDAEYIKLPEWANVVDCAKIALREIQ